MAGDKIGVQMCFNNMLDDQVPLGCRDIQIHIALRIDYHRDPARRD